MVRTAALPELLKTIRMSFLTEERLKLVPKDDFISSYPPCRDLLNEAMIYSTHSSPSYSTRPRRYADSLAIYALVSLFGNESSLYYYRFEDDEWREMKNINILRGLGRCPHLPVRVRDYTMYFFQSRGTWSLNLKTGDWIFLPSLKCHHTYGAAVTLTRKQIYFFAEECTFFVDRSNAFDVDREVWVELRNKIPTYRLFAATAVLGDHIFVTGGKLPLESAVDVTESFDTVSCEWTQLPPMLSKRARHDSTAANGVIYVCGGIDDVILKTAEVYDPVINQWMSISPMRGPRENFSLFYYNWKIYALGGRTSFDAPAHLTVEVYDFDRNEWQYGAQIPDEEHTVAEVTGVLAAAVPCLK